MRRAVLAAALALPAATVAAGDLALGLPIDCTLGETCYIQNQVDRDPGPGFADYTCGTLGYDGHKGTDIGVPTMAHMRRGVDVLASATGVVRGLRDGVPDVGVTPETAGKECGNGVVLSHGDGWETQYCHMKSGSITVRNGQRVERGQVLGQVGFSGLTEFPHVHLSVRRNGQEVDPFDITPFPACGTGGKSLWIDPPAYIVGGLLDAGFHPGVPEYETVRDGTAARAELAGDAAGLVLFGFGFGARRGDVLEMRITGPQGDVLSKNVTLGKDQAQFFRATGKRLTAPRWPAGVYTGTITMRRADRVLGRKQVRVTVR